jgi:hypothetical protein
MKLKKLLFWIGSFTWGILLTLPGAIMALVFALRGGKPLKVRTTFIFKVKIKGVSFSLGPFIVATEGYTQEQVFRLVGNSIQNSIYGPFYFFLIVVPKLIMSSISRIYDLADRASCLAGICLVMLAIVSLTLFIIGLVFSSIILMLSSLAWAGYCLYLFFWLSNFMAQENKDSSKFIWFDSQALSLGKEIYYNW